MKKRIVKVISIVLSFIIILIGYYFLNAKYNFGIPCLFYKITGYQCPGCGITRALFSLLEGNFLQALQYNFIIFVDAPFIFAYFCYKSYLYVLEKDSSSKGKKVIYYLSIILLIITLGYGILRNIY